MDLSLYIYILAAAARVVSLLLLSEVKYENKQLKKARKVGASGARAPEEGSPLVL